MEVFEVPPVDTGTCKDPLQLSIVDATTKWELYLDSLRNTFDTAWTNKCARAKELESFTVSYQKAEYHYTLYYYDQAGNLVKTVPPEGVDNRRADANFLANVKLKRDKVAIGYEESQQWLTPNHALVTEYRYNTLGQVIQQKSPDGGLSKFWYDKLGRLVVSQNAQQYIDGKYSYTVYDALGRITEVGQKPQSTSMTQTISRDPSQLSSWIAGASAKEQITRTVYDISYFSGDDLLSPQPFVQRNLRNRVSYTQVFDAQPSGNNYTGTHRAATYYTYDIHGNVDTLLQDYGSSAYYPNVMNQNGNRYKKIAYDFDLISGKVNMVTYQPGYYNNSTQSWVNNPDRFYHRYLYDAENKLIEVYTSHDSLIWERDASYYYYKHGPLVRTVIGQQQVQGVDYAYNLQGWLKGVNSTSVNDGTYDMGGDGVINGGNKFVARDAYGFSLNYYTAAVGGNTVKDYKTINSSATPFVQINNETALAGKQLYNGNISSIVMNIQKLGDPKVYEYGYDQLNRLIAVDVFNGINNSANTFTPITIDDYKERLTYDANGNIKTYQRNGTGATLNLNNYTYSYQTGTNRLTSVNNSVNTTTGNYTYDAIGNVISDGKQNVTENQWTAYGKLSQVQKNDGAVIQYSYGADGQRISKKVGNTEEWYVRDGSGNIMAVYIKDAAINSGHLTVSEMHKYGNSFLGISRLNIDVQVATTTDITVESRGNKEYYLSNHLKNTLVIVSDRKLQHTSNGTTIDYYSADVISATDYSSYGAISRAFNINITQLAFNGQKRSTEISATAQTAKFWEYNGDVGRRWNLDPRKSVSISVYVVFGNNPIWHCDPQGDTTINGEKIDDVQTLAEVRIVTPSKNYHRPLSPVVEKFYDNARVENSAQQLMDLAKLLWDESELGKRINDMLPKLPGIPAPEDLLKTAKALVKVHDDPFDAASVAFGMITGSPYIIVAYQMIFKGVFLEETKMNINLGVFELVDANWKTEGAFNYGFTGGGVKMIKSDYIDFITVSHSQMQQIMTNGFFIPSDYKGFLVDKYTMNWPQTKTDDGNKPAFYIYFNKLKEKGFLHISEVGVMPILPKQ